MEIKIGEVREYQGQAREVTFSDPEAKVATLDSLVVMLGSFQIPWSKIGRILTEKEISEYKTKERKERGYDPNQPSEEDMLGHQAY